jgi:predicted ArsR family transcriptional regulator
MSNTGCSLNPESKRYDNWRVMLDLLQKGMTGIDLADVMGLHQDTVRRAMRAMHADGLIHIAGWHHKINETGRVMAIWKAGEGKDKPKPSKRTCAKMRHARHYEKNKAVEKARRWAKSMQGNPFAQLIRATA